MEESLLQYESQIRLAAFVGIFAVVALWELAAPRRRLTASKGLRWLGNIGIVVVDTALLRLTLPILAVGAALQARQEGWGVLNRIDLPVGLEFVLAVAAMDLVIYLQHVMFHAVPALWRLHRMHHADTDFDVTTGARFHPVEILLSMGIKLATVAALGPSPGAVIVFEVLLNGTAMFNHGNIRLPTAVDRWLRLLVVTPDMHRVHHSVNPDETNSNFGFNLPWWDRLMGTYRAQPREGHEGMTIGLEQFRAPREQWLHNLLLQPLRADDGRYPFAGGQHTS